MTMQEIQQLSAQVNYADAQAGKRNELFFDQRTPGPGASQLIQAVDQRQVTMHNGRFLLADGEVFSLESQGFELIKPDLDVSILNQSITSLDQQSADQTQQRDQYIQQYSYPQVQRYLAEKLQADQVLIFDHTLRANAGTPHSKTSVKETSERTAEKSTQRRSPVKTVHNDYTALSAERQLQHTLNEHGINPEDFSRYQFVNIWLPLLNPVEESPLAMIDLRSVEAADFHNLKVIYPQRDGQISAISANSHHRWVWFSDMEPGEALLLRVFDSRDKSQISGVPHTAFDLPDNYLSSGQTPLRRTSLEIRTIALFK